ncbi:MAG TPA: FAD-binding and (Fe-S)-binding domain-containing protein, partial [Bacillota bacterium]|nr:FAD-binding and (Fe-S)-binding domain-containing protein [Bacillota bacterium]
PSLVKPFVPAGVPGAVVRPENEEQVVRLAKLANETGIRLVPRGAATSGYGGVLPVEGAVVVDMSGMAKILAVDEAGLRVTVQPGIIWEQLWDDLKEKGLDLRLYPSSAPSSTVGGWLAQGGSGFGSFEYGLFKENVLSARVVLPSGEVQEFTGAQLADYIADAEGITGIITQLTVALRKLEQEVHVALAFQSAGNLGKALSTISAEQLPVWSITFLNPESLRLKKRLPHKHGHPYEEAHEHYEPVLPEAYIVILAYPQSRRQAIETSLKQIVLANQGQFLGEDAAEHEWEQRFAPMRLKRIGPSIIPTEVIVPLASLPAVLKEIDQKVKQPFILEGMATKGDKVVLLGFIPHDERTFAFNLAFALSLTVIEIAKSHGGTAYSTGLYFRRQAKSVLGAERYQKLKDYKAKIDPKGLMNPNKVIGSGAIDTLMGVASGLEPLVRVFANAAKVPLARREDLGKEVNGIPGNVAHFATACSKCGYCVSTCEQFSGRGWESHSPRGKYFFIREVLAGREKFDQRMINTFMMCTTCEMCNTRCQLNLPVEHNWMAMRGQLIYKDKKMTFPPFEMMAAAVRKEKNIWAGFSAKRADWVPAEIKPKVKDKAEVLYFAGCTASFVNTDVAQASVHLLDKAGIEFTMLGTDEGCCGIPMKVSGRWDVFEEIAEHNMLEAKKRGSKTIVTSCPACGLAWKELYLEVAAKKGIDYDFEIKHYSEVASDAIKAGKLSFDHEVKAKVAFHDSCHAGRAQGIYEPPRDLIRAIPGVELVEMKHNREDGLCCGSVLTLIGEKEVAPILGGNRIQEAVDVGADKLVALCPCCQVQLRASATANKMDIPITDLAKLVSEGLGLDINDCSEYSMEMWGYFEKFIVLMRPEAMADLMAALFGPMMANMPPGMVPMMKAMKYIPGGLAMMGKMMPIMMPMLVPGIMPKVMPEMLEEVSRRVGPLPEDMTKQMPDLLPKTMDALMPNMLPLLIPLITPKMINYIRTEMKEQPTRRQSDARN